MSKPDNNWIQTYTGRKMHPCSPVVDEICIEDIAHALSNICRFTGHCRRFYSVAEHSVHVSLACGPKDALWGLLHDASEAYICDMSRPLKRSRKLGAEYKKVENEIQRCICYAFGLPVSMPESVASADIRMLTVEATELMHISKWDSRDIALLNGKEPKISCHPPEIAERIFLARLMELTR